MTWIVPCAIILLLAVHVSAIPPMPTEFYGSVVLDGKPAPAGTNITAIINGVEKGSIKIVVDGFYGGPGIFDDRLKVSVPEEEYKPGMLKISFMIGDKQAVQSVDYEPGVSKQLDLAVGTRAQAMTSPATYMTPVDNTTSVSTQNTVSNSNPGSYSASSSGSGSSGSGTTISYGLDQDRTFKAEDGLAELQFGKSTMLFSPDGQFLSAVGIRPKSVSDLPPLSTNKSLKFTGYAYEIIPSETYFNPKGTLVLKLPPDRAYDIINAGPSLYEYISQTASWEPVHTTSSPFTNEISGDIYEAAIYALYIPVEAHPENQSVQNSGNNQTQGSPISSNGVSVQTSVPTQLPVTTPITPLPVITPDVTAQTTAEGVQVSISQTPVITPLPTVNQAVQNKSSGNTSIGGQKNTTPISFNVPLASITSKISRPVLSIIGIALLIIIINTAVYAVYRYWWQKRKQNG